MRPNSPRRTWSFVVVVTSMLVAAPAAGQAPWEPPPGFTPDPQAPTAPLQAMVGPITFSEAEFPLGTPVNGLVVNSIGGTPLAAPLSFSFTSPDATVTLTGPGLTMFIDVPDIEGDAAGTLTIDFGLDVTRVAFGFAQNCPTPETAAVTVTAFDSSAAMIGSTTVAGADFGFFFLENGVDFTPASPARSVEITFDTSGGNCLRFALDNLAYDELAVPALPAPALALLALVVGTAGLWVLGRRRSAGRAV